MTLLSKALTAATGNRTSQLLMERVVVTLQFLMGVGSGGDASRSGERAVFDLLRRRIAPPYTIFDVGANAGQFLKVACDAMRDGPFAIHCFEPGRAAFTRLSDTAKGRAQVALNNIALGKEPGEATLHYDRAGSELASLTRRRLDHFKLPFDETESVRVETIDRYCDANGVSRVHLLKLDIEGHELDALQGAAGMFERRAIDLATFEFGGCNIDTRTYFQDFWYFFRSTGMAISRITPSGYLHPVESYAEIHEQFRTTNFVAMRRE